MIRPPLPPSRLAAQLGHPRGFAGRIVGRMLNRNNRSRIEAAVDSVGGIANRVVADLGFGGGLGLELLLDRVGPNGRVEGVDLSRTMVQRARRHNVHAVRSGRLRVHQGSLTHLPLPDRCLDAAITINTVYFLDDLTTAFAEIVRTLRAGAVLVVGLGDPEAMARLRVTRHGFRLRPVVDVAAALAEVGLTVVETRRLVDARDAYNLLIAALP